MQVSAAAFGAKYRSKRECYNFLAVDMGVYLPNYGKSSKFGANSIAVDSELKYILIFLFILQIKSRYTF